MRFRETLLHWPHTDNVVFGLLFIWLFNLSDFQGVRLYEYAEGRTSVQ